MLICGVFGLKMFKVTTFAELSSVSLPRLNWPWKKCFALLRLYTKFKTGLSSPNINEQSVWMKIAEEIGKNSPQYDAKECCNQFRWMECEYEKMKHKEPYKLRQSHAVFLDEAEIAFENIEIPDFYYLQSELEKYGMCKSDRIMLLQVYAKYKDELLLQNFDVEQQIVWGKVAREVSEKCSSFYGKRRCCCVIHNLKRIYEITKETKEKNKRKGKFYEEPYFFQEARKTFDCTECKGQHGEVNSFKNFTVKQETEREEEERREWYNHISI